MILNGLQEMLLFLIDHQSIGSAKFAGFQVLYGRIHRSVTSLNIKIYRSRQRAEIGNEHKQWTVKYDFQNLYLH